MISIYKTEDNKLKEQEQLSEGCWINVVDPSSVEIKQISKNLNIDQLHIESVLDEEERARIEILKEYSLVIVDVPYVSSNKQLNELYQTLPIAIFVTDDFILTVCIEELPIFSQFISNTVMVDTNQKNRFLLQLLYKNATTYLDYLRKIDKKSNEIEKGLHQSMTNSELLRLLALEKSLVFFTVSLKSNHIVLEKIQRIDGMKDKLENKELLEDVIIEHNQAIEMTEIYSGVLNGMLNASASIISNNLNNLMKTLTSITLVISIPTMIGSFYGMNVLLPIQGNPYAFIYILVVSVVISLLLTIFMIKKKMF